MKRQFFFLAALVFFLGCTGESANNARSALQVSFSPNPVSLSSDNKWHYRVTLRETSNIGVTIISFKIKHYTSSGRLLETESHAQDDFIEWFDDCGGQEAYIPGGLTRCADIVSWGTPGDREWVFRGRDDQGRTIEDSGAVALR